MSAEENFSSLLERQLLLLPDSKTGKRPVYLNAAAIAILERQRRDPNNPFVFSGDQTGRPIRNIQPVWQRVRTEADLANVRLHDLRHSFASIAAANGASLPMIGKLLGHSSSLTTQRYAHLVADPIKDLSDMVGNTIAGTMRKQG